MCVKNRHWRLVETGFLDASRNMAVDEALFYHKINGDIPPTLRIYGWKKPTVSAGYTQNTDISILNECRNSRYDYVCRLTGGGTVFHDRELTYSIVIGNEDVLIPRKVIELYYLLAGGIIEGLKKLGIDAQFFQPPGSPEKFSMQAQTGLNKICFNSVSKYDIVINGKKLVGSAQRRHKSAVLQHGSVVIDMDQNNAPSFVTDLIEKGKITSLTEILQREVSFCEVSRALAEGFTEAMGIIFSRDELTLSEQSLIDTLTETKYSMDAWNVKY